MTPLQPNRNCMTRRSFALASFLLCCFYACGASSTSSSSSSSSSICHGEGGTEQSCHVDEDLTDEFGLLQTKAVIEKESMDAKDSDIDFNGVSPRPEHKSVTSGLWNEMNRTCGLFGCDEPPAEFIISKKTLRYVEIDLANHNHSSTEMPEDDERLDFVTSQEAMQDFGRTFSDAMAKQVAIISTKLAAAQKRYQDEYSKLHPNENSTSGWNWDWQMKEDPAEFVDGNAPDWEAKIRLVRPGLSDADYQLGKALYTIASRSKWDILDPFGIGKAIGGAVNGAVDDAEHAVNGAVDDAEKVVNGAVNGLTFFVDLGKNIIKVVKEVQSLIDCLNNLPDKYKLTGMVQFAVDASRKPGGLLANLIPDFWNSYMPPFIDGTKQFVETQLAEGIGFDASQSIAAQIFKKINQFAKIPGTEALGCIADNLIQPAFEAVEDTLDDLVNLIVQPLTVTFNKFVSAPNGFVAKFVAKTGKLIQTDLPVTAEIGKVAKAQSSIFCLDELTRVKAGQPRTSTQDKILLVGTATLSEFLDKFFNDGVNTVFRPILEKAVGFVGQLLQTGLHALDGLCGLIPEAGAAICSLLTTIIGGSMNLASNGLLKGGLGWVMTEGDSIINNSSTFFATEVNNELTKITLPEVLTPLVPMIKDFVKLINTQIQQYLGPCDADLGQSL